MRRLPRWDDAIPTSLPEVDDASVTAAGTSASLLSRLLDVSNSLAARSLLRSIGAFRNRELCSDAKIASLTTSMEGRGRGFAEQERVQGGHRVVRQLRQLLTERRASWPGGWPYAWKAPHRCGASAPASGCRARPRARPLSWRTSGFLARSAPACAMQSARQVTSDAGKLQIHHFNNDARNNCKRAETKWL